MATHKDSTAARSERESIWSLPFVALMLVNLFQSTAAFMANVTLPVYADSLGVAPSMVGIIVSSFSISAILIRPFAGPAFDSFPRKRLLLISQGIICACLFLYGLADSVQALIGIRLLHGIGIGCSGPLAMSLVSEFLPRNRFASGISIYALAQSFAQVIGPAIGLALADSVGFSWSFFLASGSVLIAIAGVALIKEPVRERVPYQLKLDRMFAREAVSKAVALMLLATSFSCLTSYVVLYGYERGVQDMGMFFVVYALCLVLTRPLFGKLADRFGSPRIIMIGTVFFVLSYLALAAADSMMDFLGAAIISSAGFGCCGPLLQSMALASVPEGRRGAASNTAFTGLDLGMLAGPIIGGAVAEGLGGVTGSLADAYAAMWIIILIPALASFALVLSWQIRSRSSRSHSSVPS